MPSLSFEVGAIFIIEDRATAALAEIGRAFESLGELAASIEEKLMGIGEGAFAPMLAGIERASSATKLMVEQVGAVADAWGRATGAAERYGTAAGVSGGGGQRGPGGGGRGRRGLSDEERAERNMRREAEEDDREFNRRRTYTRRMGEYENQLRGPPNDGPVGPPGRPYWGQGDDWANAAEENRRFRGRGDDGLSIPPPPRTGVTDFTRARQPLPPRDRFNFDEPPPTPPTARDGGGRGGRGSGGHGDDFIQTIVDYELLHMAFKAAGGEQQALFRGAKAFDIDPTSPEGVAAMGALREAARDAAAGTSYKESGTAAGIPLLAGPFGLSGPEGVAAFSKIYPGAARAAEGMELLDPRSTFSATLPAMVEFAHESRQYEPEKLARQYDVLGAITSLVPHTTFAAEAGAMSYVVPMARAAGISPEHTAVLVGSLQQAGLRGTIAATTLRQELVGLTRGGGPMQAHTSRAMRHETHEFENAMKLQPGGQAAVKMLKGSDHVVAMHEVGLLDPKGNQTFLYTAADAAADTSGETKKGGINVDRANKIFAEWAHGKDPAKVSEEAYKLFGVRGEQAPEILGAILHSGEKDYVGQFGRNVSSRVNVPGGFLGNVRDQMSQTANQEAGQVVSRFNDVMSHLADATLPAFQGVMEKALIPFMNRLGVLTSPDEKGNYTNPQKIAGFSLGGALIGGVAGGALGLLGLGAGIVPGAMGGAMLGGAIGAGGSTGYLMGDKVKAFFNPEQSGGPFTLPNPGPGPRRGTFPHASFESGPGSVINQTITLGPVTMNGVPDDSSLRGIIDRLTKGLHDALSHMTSDATGSSMSPYTQPGPF